MAKVQGKYIRKVRRKNALKVIVVLAIFLIGISFVAFRGEKTMLIERQNYTKMADAQALFFKREVVVDFDGEIVATQKSGAKVDRYMTLADQVQLSNYYAMERKIIDYALQNEFCDNNENAYTRVNELYEKTKVAGEEGAEAAAELPIAVRALGYVSYSTDSLKTLREVYAGEAHSSSSVNLGMIPREISGCVSYDIGGYEGALDIGALDTLNVDGLNFLLAYTPMPKQMQTAFKIVSNTCVYAVVVLPAETEVDGLENALTVRERIVKGYDINNNNYYQFLLERKDIMRTFPRLKIDYNDTVITGFFVDAKQIGGRLVLVLGVADGIQEAMMLNREAAGLHAEEYFDICLLPESAVYQNSFGEDCINILAATKERKTYTITVLNEDNGYYVCRIYARPADGAGGEEEAEVRIDGMALLLR